MDSEEAIEKVYSSVIEQESFKKWFNGSKVEQDNKPIIMYHGTGADISKFKQPAFFTPEKENAAWYSYESSGNPKVIAALLSIKNPIILDDKESVIKLQDILVNYGMEADFIIDHPDGLWEFYWDLLEKYKPGGDGLNPHDVVYIPEVRDILIKEVYDGLYSPHDQLCNGDTPIFVTFYQEQIRIIGQIDIKDF